MSPFARAAAIFVAACALSGGAVGCASKLETGYEPRTLGSSTETRRGFYAEPFSPEAQRAKQYEDDFGGSDYMRRRPGR